MYIYIIEIGICYINLFLFYIKIIIMEEHHTNSFQEDRYMTPHVKGILYISYILIIYEIYNFFYIYFFSA
jgi:hypothetical protein